MGRKNEQGVTRVAVKGEAEFTHRDRYGGVLGRWRNPNRIFNTGLSNFLKARLAGDASVSVSTWYMGLILGKTSAITLAAGDTPSSTSLGWSESTHYSNATRPKWTPSAESGQSISNTTAAVVFNVNTSTTVGGIFLISSSAKGNIGTTNEVGSDMHSGIVLSQTRTMSSGDTLSVTYTNTMVFSST